MVGKQIGNYVVLRVLGKGGMGTVYLAENPAIKRRVAIKVLPADLTGRDESVGRFLAEAQAVAALDHPNIIDIYDFGRTDDGCLYYVMEALEGRDLNSVINHRGKLPAEEVLPYLEQLCSALEVVHQKRIVHRDLKPANIFVTDEREVAIKILDFGLAKLLEQEPGADILTQSGTILGTPISMAPEQATSQAHELGPQTDIYSIGVLLFWMLAGRPPFIAPQAAALLAYHVMKPPPPLREIEPSVPAPIAALVDQCLQKNPSRRPPSARAVSRAYAAALSGSVEAGPPQETTPAPRSPSTRPISTFNATLPPAAGFDLGEVGASSWKPDLASLAPASTSLLLAAAAVAVAVTATLIVLIT